MSDDRRVVFVTNLNPKHEYDAAAKFGAMRPVTSGNYPVFKTDRLIEEIVTALLHSKETDYLLFSGSSFIGGLCLAVWLQIHKECHALLYDAKQTAYVPRTIRRPDLSVQIERIRDRILAARAR